MSADKEKQQRELNSLLEWDDEEAAGGEGGGAEEEDELMFMGENEVHRKIEFPQTEEDMAVIQRQPEEVREE